MSESAYRITALPAYSDNYIWVLSNATSAVVIDPGDHAPVLEFLHLHKLTLAAILVTHHHWDHVDGIAPLLQSSPAPVYGPANERIPERTHALGEGDRVEVPELSLHLDVIEVPGHTLGHIAYLDSARKPAALFCGDTLFAAGCGRLFEGTPEQMYDSLQRLATLAGDTEIYCTHEYTEANLAFAVAADAGNPVLLHRQQQVSLQRRHGQITLPSTLDKELQTNPFLRCDQPQIMSRVSQECGRKPGNAMETFTELRRWKDRF